MRHVQTELPDALYAVLARQAREEGRPLKELLRDAVEAYLNAARDPMKDPLLDIVGAGSLDDAAWSERKDWRTAPP